MHLEEIAQKLQDNIQKVLVGKQALVELSLVALLSEGHLLLEDVPGIGKTTLARAIARSLDCSFGRIQFTPDLLPSDISGISYFDQESRQFKYRPGPILKQIVLADEINRATPRTQSALLEAMQEKTVTVDGETHHLPQPFLVLATQNPVELEGTFPLPEAQLDRFLMKISLGYPNEDEENEILLRYQKQDPMQALAPIIQAQDLEAAQVAVQNILVEASIRQYMVKLVRATREHQAIELGVSPRGSLALYRSSQALAALRGRTYVLPDDVKYLAPFVLSHRLLVNPQTRLRGHDPELILAEIIETVPVPVEQFKQH